ncbi:MAG: phosphatase PAP2 family protein [Burkholderiaceae bacterium]
MQSKHLLLNRALRNTRRDVWVARDLVWARWLHRVARYQTPVKALVVVSKLGDGFFWYVLIAGLALLGGTHGRDVAAQMVLAGLLNLPLYFGLKHSIGRPRPYVACPDIRACVRALDKFSFPSGHTLHAVAFAVVFTWHFLMVGAALLPLVVLIALSRVALGLHYPSDVAAGAVIGAIVGLSVVLIY